MPDITPKEESPGEDYIRTITIEVKLCTAKEYAVRCPEWKYSSWQTPDRVEATVGQIVRAVLEHNNEVTRLKDEEKDTK